MATGFEGTSDRELLDEIKKSVSAERRCVEKMIRRLAEIDNRSLYLPLGFSSLFAFCVEELGLCESEAGRRIRVCRAASRYPRLFEMIGSGAFSVTGLAILVPALTDDNWRQLVIEAAHKSTREIDSLVAQINGRPERPDRIRSLGRRQRKAPSGAPQAEPLLPEGGAEGEALSSSTNLSSSQAVEPAEAVNPDAEPDEDHERIEFRFTADKKFLQNLTRAREILFSTGKSSRLETVLGVALDEMLERRDPLRKAARIRARRERTPSRARTKSPKTPLEKPSRRTVPAKVKRAVQERDKGRCTFISSGGRRCSETKGLQIDHIVPFAAGGSSNDPANLRLLCRAHNLYEAKNYFGEEFITERIDGRKSSGDNSGSGPGENVRPPPG